MIVRLLGCLLVDGVPLISYKNFGERIGAAAREVRLARVEGDVEDRLVELLPMRRDLLDTGAVLEVPQPHGAVVT